MDACASAVSFHIFDKCLKNEQFYQLHRHGKYFALFRTHSFPVLSSTLN